MGNSCGMCCKRRARKEKWERIEVELMKTLLGVMMVGIVVLAIILG